MSKYTVTLMELTPKMARVQPHKFTVDPEKTNIFKLQLDAYREIYVRIEHRPWWRFWR